MRHLPNIITQTGFEGSGATCTVAALVVVGLFHVVRKMMSGAAMAAVAWGRPACMPSWAPIWSEPDISHIKKAKKAGIKKGEAAAMTAAAVLTTPLAAWAGRAAGTHIGDSLAGENGPFGHWAEKDGEIIPGEKHDIKTYEQKHIDKAEIWNNSDGVSHGARYTRTARSRWDPLFMLWNL